MNQITTIAPACATLIKKHRIAARLSQESMAHRCGVDHSLLSRIESGMRSPTRESIGKIAAGMKLTPEQHDALLIAADFKPLQAQSMISDEPYVASVYNLLKDDRLSEPTRDALRVSLAGLVGAIVAAMEN